MTMTDPVADFLTRIRNAQMALKPWTDIRPNCKLPGNEKTISSLLSLLEVKKNDIKLYKKNI